MSRYVCFLAGSLLTVLLAVAIKPILRQRSFYETEFSIGRLAALTAETERVEKEFWRLAETQKLWKSKAVDLIGATPQGPWVDDSIDFSINGIGGITIRCDEFCELELLCGNIDRFREIIYRLHDFTGTYRTVSFAELAAKESKD